MSFSHTLQVFFPSKLQVIKKMENLVRLRILSNSAISDLKYYSHKPLDFSEMKIVTPPITLLLEIVEVVFRPVN